MINTLKRLVQFTLLSSCITLTMLFYRAVAIKRRLRGKLTKELKREAVTLSSAAHKYLLMDDANSLYVCREAAQRIQQLEISLLAVNKMSIASLMRSRTNIVGGYYGQDGFN